MATKGKTQTDGSDDNPVAEVLLKGKWLKQWKRRIGSGEQLIETVTTEPQTVEQVITAGALSLKIPVITWDYASGFQTDSDSLKPKLENELGKLFLTRSADVVDGVEDPNVIQPISAIRAVKQMRLPDSANYADSAIFVFHNFYPFLGDPLVAQALENLVKDNRLSCRLDGGQIMRRPIHFVQTPYGKLDLKGIETVRHWIQPMPFDLPDEDEIYDVYVAQVVKAATALGGKVGDTEEGCTDRYKRSLAAACRGLERHKVTTVLFYAASTYGGLDGRVPGTVRREAASMIASTSAIDVVLDEDITPPEQLGGIRNALRSLERAARTFTDEGKTEQLDPAGGVYLIGTPGTGKSQLAMTSAKVFQRITGRAFTVIRLKPGALFGGVLGETQMNLYDALRRIEAFGPDTVLWIDEFDKAFGGVMDGRGDSGVRQEIFGDILTWLSSPKRQCYVIAAMNDPSGIPPEFFRRFDDGFFFDLPSASARKDIAKIHFLKRLKRVGKTLNDLGFDEKQWDELSVGTAGWIPSEIEGLVKQSRNLAFENRSVGTPTFEEVLFVVNATKDTILSVKNKDQLHYLKEKCKDAKPVDDPDDGGPTLATTKSIKKKPAGRGFVVSEPENN